MKNRLSGDPAYDLWVLLGQTTDTISRARRRELHSQHISGRRLYVIFAIKTLDEKTTVAQLARFLVREPHSISELLSRMEKAGMVRKVKDPDRSNQTKVMLTEKAREIYNRTSKRESIHQIMLSLSEEERHQLRSCLQKVRDKALIVMGLSMK